jgi:phospholipase C
MRTRWDILHRPLFACAAPAFALSGCGGGTAAPPPTLAVPIVAPAGTRTASKFQHVLIIVQENQSFDHLFNGYPKANTVSTCKIHTGKTVPLTIQPLGAPTSTSHMAVDFLTDYDGGAMDGFDLDPAAPQPRLGACTYTDPADIAPYYQMAQQYVLSDNTFASHIDASFIGHQILIAGVNPANSVNLPTGSWGCSTSPNFVPTLNADRTIGGFTVPCYTVKTLADELDAKKYSWHFYAPSINDSGGAWSAYQAISQIYNGPDWANDVISPETTVLTDIAKGTLENVTWVIPDYCNSDHPGSLGSSGCGTPGGPDWVASIVNAVGKSKFWSTTEIFVVWDEWGGEYDHVVPPYKDADGDGFRVPMLCISPYAYKNKVNHAQMEVAGIVKAVEKTFVLASLAAPDKRAASADFGCINPKQTTPRAFVPITTSLDAEHFIHERHSKLPPDDT